MWVGGVVAAVFVVWIAMASKGSVSAPRPLDTFATCLKDRGVTFYGAFWCPHCQNQKKLFGRSAKLLPYVECSTADGKGQLPVCKDQNITSYPTWDFPPLAGATSTYRYPGEMELSELAERSGCAPPTATE
jgi:thiol-disulfide isomerase/thioredoxin